MKVGELVKDAKSGAPGKPANQNLRMGPLICVLTSPLGDYNEPL